MPALQRLAHLRIRPRRLAPLAMSSSPPRRFASSRPDARATALTRFVDENGAIRCGQRTDDGSTALLVEDDDPLGSLHFTGETATIEKVLVPVVPSQILGIGLNYRKHAKETNMPEPKFPVLFTKGVNALQNPHDPVVIPRVASDPPEVDYECELAVVLKEACRDVTEEEALSYVGGYTCANDISARRWQGKKGGGQWCRAKTFDTFCPLGPVLMTPEVILTRRRSGSPPTSTESRCRSPTRAT